MLSDAVESPARGFPVDTCSGTRQLQSDQSQENCPQPAKQEVKQVESSARRQVHMHKKGKKHAGGQGGELCLPPARNLHVSGNQTKPGITFPRCSLICLFSFSASLPQTRYQLLKHQLSLDKPPEKSRCPPALNAKQDCAEGTHILC